MFRYQVYVVALLAACIAGKAAAEDESIVVTAGEGSYTCEDAERIKFNATEYQKLSTEQQMQVDLQWQTCKAGNAEPGAEKAALIVETKDKKVGFGILGNDDIRHFRQHCNNISTGANAILVTEESVLGPLVAIGSAGVCNGIAAQMAKSNALVVLAPPALIGAYSIKSAANFALSPADAKNVSSYLEKRLAAAPKVDLGEALKDAEKAVKKNPGVTGGVVGGAVGGTAGAVIGAVGGNNLFRRH